MNNTIDVLFISNSNKFNNYQDLSLNLSACEPPTWALLLAQSCRAVGFNPKILDISAENLSIDESISRIFDLNPRLLCFVVYGQNVNAGSANMTNNVELSEKLKNIDCKIPISYVGSHVQALPRATLINEPSIDFVFMNEGVYALRNILSLDSIDVNNLENIKGIAWRKNDEIVINDPEIIVPNEKMDIDLPGYAWDLLPYKNQPFDLYSSPLWHAEYIEENRSPYASIQTSLGCQFNCSFCMINMINRNDTEEVGVASNYNKMRYWSPEFIFNEFKKLYDYGVRTIKITDEMFLLNKKYYEPLCHLLAESGMGEELRMWAYSRVDTVRNPELLKLIKSAGIKWLALGIESSNKKVRLEVTKGKFEDVDVEKVVRQIEDVGIQVIANYMFGLPGETLDTMKNTLDFSIDLNTAAWNAFPAIALPGSKLYKESLNNNQIVPKNYEEFSFLGRKTIPLYNELLTRKQILQYRDFAFSAYHSNPKFIEKIRNLFGEKAVHSINEMLKTKMIRD